jgi:hypothetical protein
MKNWHVVAAIVVVIVLALVSGYSVGFDRGWDSGFDTGTLNGQEVRTVEQYEQVFGCETDEECESGLEAYQLDVAEGEQP